MRVIEDGFSTPVELSQYNYITCGQKSVLYAKDSTCYKLFHDKKNCITKERIAELDKLQSKKIITPNNILFNMEREPVGYTMRFLKNARNISKTFAKHFRDCHSFTPNDALNIVGELNNLILHIHLNGFAISKLSESKIIFDENYRSFVLLGCDSFVKTDVESLKDNDWTDFARIAFQIFTGTHPLKDENGGVTKYKIKSFPKTCYPITLIPDTYIKWFHQIFSMESRTEPPFCDILPKFEPLLSKDTTSKVFNITKIRELPTGENIIHFLARDGYHVCLTKEFIYKNESRILPSTASSLIGLTKNGDIIRAAKFDNGNLKNVVLYSTTQSCAVEFPFHADDIMSYEGRLFWKDSENFYEMMFHESNQKTCAARLVGIINEKNGRLFDGVEIDNWGEKCIVSIPLGEIESFKVKIKEILGYVVDAKYDNNILMVVTYNKSQFNTYYTRYTVRFSKDRQSYDLTYVSNIAYNGLNFVVLDSGICCHLAEDDKLHVFSNEMGNQRQSIIISDNEIINDNCKLFKDGDLLMAARDNILYQVDLK